MDELKVYELLDIEKSNPIISEEYHPSESLWETFVINQKEEHHIETTKNNKKRKVDESFLPDGLKFHVIDSKKYNNKLLFDKFKSMYHFYNQTASFDILEPGDRIWEVFHVLKINGVKKRNQFPKIIETVEKTYPEFKKYIMFAFDQVIKQLNVPKSNKELYDFLYKKCMFGVIYYRKAYWEYEYETGWNYIENDARMKCHIMNADKRPNIEVTISLGNEYYEDYIPYFYTEKELDILKPLRVRMKPGTIRVFDGEARLAWQKCMPSGYSNGNEIIVLKFSFPSFAEYNKNYNKTLEIFSYTSFKK